MIMMMIRHPWWTNGYRDLQFFSFFILFRNTVYTLRYSSSLPRLKDFFYEYKCCITTKTFKEPFDKNACETWMKRTKSDASTGNSRNKEVWGETKTLCSSRLQMHFVSQVNQEIVFCQLSHRFEAMKMLRKAKFHVRNWSAYYFEMTMGAQLQKKSKDTTIERNRNLANLTCRLQVFKLTSIWVKSVIPTQFLFWVMLSFYCLWIENQSSSCWPAAYLPFVVFGKRDQALVYILVLTRVTPQTFPVQGLTHQSVKRKWTKSSILIFSVVNRD